MTNVPDFDANATESLIYAPPINMLKSLSAQVRFRMRCNLGGLFLRLRNHLITSHVQMMEVGRHSISISIGTPTQSAERYGQR
jgi:hypothetical protein